MENKITDREPIVKEVLTDEIRDKIKEKEEQLQDYEKEKGKKEEHEEEFEKRGGIRAILPFILFGSAGALLLITIANDLKTAKGGKMEEKAEGVTE